MISWLGTSFKKQASHLIFMWAMKKPLLDPHRSGKQPLFSLLRFSRCFAICCPVRGTDVYSYLRFRSQLSQWWSQHSRGTWIWIKLHWTVGRETAGGLTYRTHWCTKKRGIFHAVEALGWECVRAFRLGNRGPLWSRGRPAVLCTWNCLKVIQTAGLKTVCVCVCACVWVCVCARSFTYYILFLLSNWGMFES